MKNFSYDFPYPSQRMPVMAKNIVATSQPLAAQAGITMLQQGGNAVDAAIAAAIALTVVEPTSNGIGSDGFAIIWDGRQLHGLNASGRSPAGWTPEYFAAKYPGVTSVPARGVDSITIPGAVSQWVTLSEKFGKLPFEKLFVPAIGYARDGFLVSPITAVSWARQAEMLKDHPDFVRDFTPGGRAPRAGEKWILHGQASTLEDIAVTRGKSFYQGELAQQMAAHTTQLGGVLRADDLDAHACNWVGTIHMDYRQVRLHEIPPNGQGIAALIGLGILENFDLASHRVDSVTSVHLQIEAMKLAFADAARYIADARFMNTPVAALLDKSYLKSRAALIDTKLASVPAYGIPKHGGTVYLTTADASGMMVSLIQSNYMGFGSGVVVPGTGISLQNRGHGFVLEAGHPNQVAPGKRPFQTIIPGFLTDHANKPLMSFGVMGGHMQAQGHVQMVVRMCDYDQNPQAASDAPRWIVNPDGTVGLEDGLKASIGAALEEMGHKIATAEAVNFAFGGAQLIWRLGDDGYVAGSDHRKDGGAVGY
ncbi:MAG: gamma-glutamyltransferase family protein [Burkholderiales bacterium]|nr:gamma-glutamyltransferase family protein [Burkholderiales bacterium]